MTPLEVLEQYKLQSDESMQEQAALFRAMAPLQQRELLFYMMMHTTSIVQQLHASIDASAAKTTAFSDFKVTKQ